ncbi:MAG: hypothetical protein KJP07_02545 [Desulfatitalea sp.]|nr:hypothetical protein [Desulfatitalea sp.]
MLNTFLFILIAVIAAAVIFVLARRKKTQAENPESSPAAPAAAASGPDIHLLLENLFQVNLLVRLQAEPVAVIQLVEEIIDDTRSTLPAMMERYPDETLTYRMEKICEKDLNAQLKEFFDLSPDGREKYVDDLIGRLEDVKRLVHRAREIVEQNEVSEFKMIARELEIKFGQGV